MGRVRGTIVAVEKH